MMDRQATGFVERARCPTCGSAGETLLSLPYADPRVGQFVSTYYEARVPLHEWPNLQFRIEACSRCALLWQRWIPDTAHMSLLYESWISPQHSLEKKTAANVSLFMAYAREMEAIAALNRDRDRPPRVLDFGMGWGFWCRMASAFGYSVGGLEPSQQRRDYAREHGIESFADLDAIGERRYDFINCEQVFEHLAAPAVTLKRLTRCLDDGGVIRVAVPDGRNARSALADPAWQAGKDHLQPLEHINCFSHQALLDLAAGAGLSWMPEAPVTTSNAGTCLYLTKARPVTRRMPASRRAAAGAAGSQLTCVVRSIGERTTAACEHLLRQALGQGRSDSVSQVGNKAFTDTLADSLRAGIAGGRKWTLCVDADVLPFANAVDALLEQAETLDDDVVEVQGLVFDRLFGGWRPAGVHLYRTAHLQRALELVPAVSSEVRPETSLLHRLHQEGLAWRQIELGFGLHDFGQSTRDIYRKCFIHAWKHVNLVPRMLAYWRARAAEADFRAALQGLAAGVAHSGPVIPDFKAAHFVAPRFDEVPPITADNDLRDLLRSEEDLVHRLGSERAPVWDWARRHWSDEQRRRALHRGLQQAIEGGVRACKLIGGNSVAQTTLENAAAAWGLGIDDSADAAISWHHDDRLGLRRSDRGTDYLGPFPPIVPETDHAAAAARLLPRLADQGIGEILIYGAGDVGRSVHDAATRQGIRTAAFLRTPGHSGPDTVLDRPVLPLDVGLARNPGVDIVIASFASYRAMTQNLLAAGLGAATGIWFLQ